MKDYIRKIKAWAEDHPALAGVILAGIVVVIYYLIKRARRPNYQMASEVPYIPPMTGGGSGGGLSDPGDSPAGMPYDVFSELNKEMLAAYNQQMAEMLSGFGQGMENMLASFAESFSTNTNAGGGGAESGGSYYTESYNANSRTFNYATDDIPFIPGSVIPVPGRDPYVIPDIPPMVFKIFDNPAKQQGVSAAVIKGQSGPFVAYGNSDVVSHFQSNPNTSIDPGGGNLPYVLDFRNRPQSESQKAYSKSFSDVKGGRSLEDAWRDLVEAGLLQGDPAAGEKAKAARGV